MKKKNKRAGSFKRSRRLVLVLGFSFLYLPMALLVLFSFNEGRFVGAWTGFSGRWYTEVFQREAFWAAVQNSLLIASISATVSVFLGTFAGYSLVRYTRFKGRRLFSSMLASSLILPEVITGMSFLIFFSLLRQTFHISLGGISMITIAYISFSTAYVTVIIQSRLANTNFAMEEAAMDLGASPFKAFTSTTLPFLVPALVSGWLLSFTLALDDVVVASFLSQGGSATLQVYIYSLVGKKGLISPVAVMAALTIYVALAVALLVVFNPFRRFINVKQSKKNRKRQQRF